MVLASAPAHLGQAGRVRVVDHAHLRVELLMQRRAEVEADRGLVHVGRRLKHAILDDGGKPASHGTLPARLGDHLDRRPDYSLRRGGLRSLDPYPLLHEFAGLGVYRRALDPRPPMSNPNTFLYLPTPTTPVILTDPGVGKRDKRPSWRSLLFPQMQDWTVMGRGESMPEGCRRPDRRTYIVESGSDPMNE